LYVGGGFLAEEIIYLYTSHLDFFKVIQNTSNPENELEVFFVKGDFISYSSINPLPIRRLYMEKTEKS
jgi:hypothetical protein